MPSPGTLRAAGGVATYAGRPGGRYSFTAQTFDQAGHGSPLATSRTRVLVLKNLADPTVRGRLAVGRTVRVTPGRCNISGVSLTYRWLAAERPIAPRASSSARRFTVTGKRRRMILAVRVTAHAPGQRPVVRVVRAGRVPG